MVRVKAKDWRNLEIEKWTIGSFQQYLVDTHQERYGIAYTARSYAVEGRWLKQLLAEHGPKVLRRFIDACVEEYKPTREYPGLNFAFMFTYQRTRILPRVLADIKREEEREVKRAQSAEATKINEADLDWL